MIEPPSCFTETAKPKSMTRGVFEVTLSEWIGTTVFCVLTEDTKGTANKSAAGAQLNKGITICAQAWGLSVIPQSNMFVPQSVQYMTNESPVTCAHGGFNLAKFVTNSRPVLKSVPDEARAQDVRTLELGSSELPVERALGVQWAIESDTFRFRIILKDQPLTRRGILSTISSVYDPLGIAAPFLLVGKSILQDLCRTKLSWDEEIGEEYRVRWENWKKPVACTGTFLYGAMSQACELWYSRLQTNPQLLRC